MVVLSDIHGNVVALEAVLAETAPLRIERYWVLGDLVAHGPRPVETIHRLKTLPGMSVIRANTDRYVVTAPPWPEAKESMHWTRDRLQDAGKLEWLAALPLEAAIDGPGGESVRWVHASPGNDDGPGLDDSASEDQLVARAFTAEAGDLILVGHTHLAANRQLAGAQVVNPGAISLPRESDEFARWAAIEFIGDGWTVEHRASRYDRAAVLADLDNAVHPSREWLRAKMTTPWS